MLTVHGIRGVGSSVAMFAGSAAVALAMLVAAGRGNDSKPAGAELSTFAAEDGQTFFALSITPPAVATAPQPHDVVILFDTSASQTGMFRETALAALEACVAKLDSTDRVQIVAADLEARPITEKFLPAKSEELKDAIKKLRNEPPLGSTDMENVLRTAATKFDKDRAEGRVVLYIGDGISNANLSETDSFRSLVDELSKARVSVSSYAIGPRIDGRLLAALANQTGGNLYIAEPLEQASEAEKITEARAIEENTRRGGTVGASMADWAHATVFWPTKVTWPSELSDVYPKTLTPLRSDRDTVAIGTFTGPIDNALAIKAQFAVVGKPADLEWNVTPKKSDAGYAYLPQVVQTAKADDGVTLPSVGSAGLAETGRIAEANVDNLTDLAERAVATGDIQAAQVASQAVLKRDPGNIKAKTVQRVIEKQGTAATPVAQVTQPPSAPPAAATAVPIPPQAPPVQAAAAPTAAPSESNELTLVRPTTAVPPQGATAAPSDLPTPGASAPPAAGSLTDRFAPERRSCSTKSSNSAACSARCCGAKSKTR